MKFTAKPTTWYTLDLGNGFFLDRCTKDQNLTLVTIWEGTLMKGEEAVHCPANQHIITLSPYSRGGFHSFMDTLFGSVDVGGDILPILAASEEVAKAIMATVKQEGVQESEETGATIGASVGAEVDSGEVDNNETAREVLEYEEEGEAKKRAKARHRRT